MRMWRIALSLLVAVSVAAPHGAAPTAAAPSDELSMAEPSIDCGGRAPRCAEEGQDCDAKAACVVKCSSLPSALSRIELLLSVVVADAELFVRRALYPPPTVSRFRPPQADEFDFPLA